MEPYQNFIEESPSVRISGCRYKDIGTDYIFKIKRKHTVYELCRKWMHGQTSSKANRQN